MDARDPEAVRGSGGRRRLKPPGVEGRDMGGCLDEEGKSDVEEGRWVSIALVSVAGESGWRHFALESDMAGCLGGCT